MTKDNKRLKEHFSKIITNNWVVRFEFEDGTSKVDVYDDLQKVVNFVHNHKNKVLCFSLHRKWNYSSEAFK